jgi:3-oxoacyl-[acyl-carrier protein] reductase
MTGKTNQRKLEGRRALITGGSRGIGAAIALAFADEGCDVGFCHLDDGAKAAEVVAAIVARGRRAFAAPCDVADENAVPSMVSSTKNVLGGIDIVVNCAGHSAEVPFEDISVEAWDRMLAVHLRGTFLVTRCCYPAMCDRGWGRIINIASQHALKGTRGKAHYCAANAGIIGMTKGLAREAAPRGVLVNAIAPGPVETDLFNNLSEEWRAEKMAELPLGRFGTPGEIAPTAVMLASADGAYYVGQTLSPNGGDAMA